MLHCTALHCTGAVFNCTRYETEPPHSHVDIIIFFALNICTASRMYRYLVYTGGGKDTGTGTGLRDRAGHVYAAPCRAALV